MIKDFNKYVILTTKTPEAFLNFRHETSDPSITFSIKPSSDVSSNVLYVNGIDISIYGDGSDPSLYIFLPELGDPSIASFHLYTRQLYDFNYNLTIDCYFDTSLVSYDVSIYNRQNLITDINTYNVCNTLVDDETSYLLLRSNPKFTGNIKLVIDPSDNLFLDTIKVSDILNNKKYRRQSVSSNSVLSSDIRNVFSSLPLGELYKISDTDTLNISVPKTYLYDQYNLDYCYGSRLLKDELYDDDYALFAPLWINNKIPDYFAIFRLSGTYNQETYDYTDPSNLANKYLQQSSLIKSWNLKQNSAVGIYLNNHLNDLLNYRSSLFLSLSDPNQKDPDPNTWYGIAFDKGIITGRSETPYMFDLKNNFTDINAFISQGFERLNLLNPNLLNLEFIFSDNDVSNYTMQRYFGLYLTDNVLYNISYYSENDDASILILSLDDKDPSVFINSSIFDSSGNINTLFQNRIFTLNDKTNIKRISNKSNIDGSLNNYINSYINKPGDQLFSAEVERKQYSNKFITIGLKNLLNQGEHLRIIDVSLYKIWEVYGIDSDLLDAEEVIPYLCVSDSSSPYIYRTVFSTKGSKNNQIKAIQNAFNVFDNYDDVPFKTTIRNDNLEQLTIEIKDEEIYDKEYWFQRITSQSVIDINDPSSDFNNSASYDDILFYGVLEPSIYSFERLSIDSSYGPFNFEIYGERMSIMLKLIDTDNKFTYSFDSSYGTLFDTHTLYLGTDNRYRKIVNFDISTSIDNHSFQYINDPTDFDEKSLIKTNNQLYTYKNRWLAYNTYPLTISLMGINSVKDFDFTVYDNSLGFQSKHFYSRNDDLSTYIIESTNPFFINNRDCYKIISGTGFIQTNGIVIDYDSSTSFNTFEGSTYICPSTNTIVSYLELDGCVNYKSYNNISEENINNYYLDPSTKSKLKYGLIVPYVSKWNFLGSDCRNNPLILSLDSSIINDASSNFIPYQNNFNQEITFPQFKYLNSGDDAWKNYIYYDINDCLIDSSLNYYTFKDLMLSDLNNDVFSKLIYSNNGINKTYNKSSLLYYNANKQSVDTIINGLNLSIYIDDVAKNILDVKDWDKFKISIISTSSKNRDSNYPIEVIINENTKTFLIIWYQGSDNLNYNKRFSSYINGKNLLEDSSLFEQQSFKQNDQYWSYIKTPFIVDNYSYSTDINNIYNASSYYDTSVCTPFCQLNWNYLENKHSIFNAYNNNYVSSNSFIFNNKSYNTFNQFIDYDYKRNISTYGDSVINFSNTYMNNYNIYYRKVCSLELFNSLLVRNNIKYYIIRENTIYDNSYFSSSPLLFVINTPRNYKNVYTYNGWLKPSFNNILEFNYNEDKTLCDILNLDFVYGNTNLNSYNGIPQLWYNKIVSAVSTNDVSIKNAIGFSSNFNVFKSQWDNDYYLKDNSTYIDGFYSSLEMPSFFGSKLIKLPYSLILDEWDLSNAKIFDNTYNYSLKFNLTKKITLMFKNNETFINNWSGLTTSDNLINEYIKNTISNYYNINKSKIKVDVYNKTYDGNSILSYTYDNSFVKVNNIDGNLDIVNEEFIYTINVNKTPRLTYYIKITLFEI